MKLSVKSKIIFLVVLCLIILLVPHIIRYVYYNNLLIGEESYYNLRLANFIHEHGVLPSYDDLSYGGRPVVSEIGWLFLLSINPDIMSRLLPLLFGVFSSILFFFIAKKINPGISFISSILFVISPSFIYLFSVSTKYSVGVFLGLLGFYFILSGYYLFGVLFLSLISLFSFWGSVIFLFLFIALSLWKRYSKKWFCIAIFLSVGFLVVQYSRLIFLDFPEFNFFYLRDSIPFLNILISDFGGLYGVGFVTLVLSLIGMYILWKYKYRYVYIYLGVIVLLALNAYLFFISFYLNMFVALLGGYGFLFILDSKWESSLAKKVMIIVIVSALVFSTVSYIDRLSSLQPRNGIYDAIYYLQRKPGEDTVFSHYERGLWISYGGKKNVMDSNFFYAPDVKKRFMDSNILLHTQDINTATEILNKYNIKYIWIDKWMEEEVWDDEEELLFLLKYSERFKKVFDNGVVEVWRFKG